MIETYIDDATEAELSTAMQSGRSLKVIGAKVLQKVDKSYYLPVEWDHSGLESGKRRLQRAVESVDKFPKPTDAARKMIGNAKLLLELRTLVLSVFAGSCAVQNDFARSVPIAVARGWTRGPLWPCRSIVLYVCDAFNDAR